MLRRLGLMTNFAALAPAAGASYDADASAFFARMSTDPGATRKGLYNDFVLALKTGAVSGSNIWAKLDIIYLLAAHEQATAPLNLKGTSYTATENGTLTFTGDRGYTGDGTTGYLDTGLTDNVGSPNWTADSAMAGVYINSDPVNSSPIMGLAGSTTTTLTPRSTGSGLAAARTHSGVNVTAATSNRLGFTCIQRPDNANHEVWKNGSQLNTAARATSALAAANIVILRANTSYATDRVGAFVLGGALTANEHTDLYNAVSAYLTAIGAN